jgi:hypothetical protein
MLVMYTDGRHIFYTKTLHLCPSHKKLNTQAVNPSPSTANHAWLLYPASAAFGTVDAVLPAALPLFDPVVAVFPPVVVVAAAAVEAASSFSAPAVTATGRNVTPVAPIVSVLRPGKLAPLPLALSVHTALPCTLQFQLKNRPSRLMVPRKMSDPICVTSSATGTPQLAASVPGAQRMRKCVVCALAETTLATRGCGSVSGRKRETVVWAVKSGEEELLLVVRALLAVMVRVLWARVRRGRRVVRRRGDERRENIVVVGFFGGGAVCRWWWC